MKPETGRKTDPKETPLNNREVSFLGFNRRVLSLAADESMPLLERLRYLCISASNLDEFFEVRVAGVKQKIDANIESAGVDGLSPQQEMAAIDVAAHDLVAEQYRTLNDVLIPALREQGIRFLARNVWDKRITDWVEKYFESDIAPVLSPLGLDPAHPFPRITNKSLCFFVELQGIDAFGREPTYAVLQAPRSLPRVIPVPEEVSGVPHGFVFLSSIVHSQISQLFKGMDPRGVYQFKVTRNSDLYVAEEEVANLRRALESELLHRSFGKAVRLEVASNCPKSIVRFLQTEFDLDDRDVYRVDGPVNLNRLMSIPDAIDRPELKFPAFAPELPALIESRQSIFEYIAQRSPVIIHHPYQSYLPVVDLVRQAASDPQVLAIKQTLYRTGHESVFVSALMEASRAGKDVTVVIELRARFDEEANIALATRLQDAGIQVVYGVVGFKTHAKMLLVVRREKNKLVRYCHLGTGNYHAGTARLYTDVSLMTNDKRICEDVHRVFIQLTGLGRTLELNSLIQAPFTFYGSMQDFIAHETEVARKGGKGHIMARMNSLVDPSTIKALYEASAAGVTVDLVVRGICMLRPGLEGISENIRVVSILGRFLEHSRVFWFYNEGKSKLYISSADWMPRNFFSRVEVASPLEDDAMMRIKHETLDIYLRDNTFSWELQPDGSYERLTPGDIAPFSAQQYLIDLYDSNIPD
ncbi:MAG: polyphosphate kinase 1 [Gammaproteobacteria bacterium]|nr:MAG: polyphosphate kinase 1 [Gammaproteobacteria bacterium]